MRILFTNDDGFDSQGLHAVADLFKNEHDIAVVAPRVERSGFSHSITLKSPFKCKKIDGYDYPVYAIDGTPVDCVKIACAQIFMNPDVVISGINRGRNIGTDIMYSGTVGAACDGAYMGHLALALSLDKADAVRADYDACAAFVYKNFNLLIRHCTQESVYLNVNFPAYKFQGVKTVRMSTLRAFNDCYQALDHIESFDFAYNGTRFDVDETDSDEAYCARNYITITPLKIDRTDYAALKKLKREKFIL